MLPGGGLNSFPYNAFSQNAGVLMLTRVYDRYVMVALHALYGRCAVLHRRRLRECTDNHEENPTMNLPAEVVLSRGQKANELIGPISELEKETAELQDGFWRTHVREGESAQFLESGPLELFPDAGSGFLASIITRCTNLSADFFVPLRNAVASVFFVKHD